jgi:hypothetical protein
MPLQPGDTIRLETTFTIDDVLTDPSAVSVTITTPSGTSTTYTYAAAQVVKASTGSYYYDYTAADAGIYVWRWVGTGTANGVDEGTFTVDRALASYPGLCSLDDVKLSGGIAEDLSDDHILSLIASASDIIQNQWEREFTPTGSATRTFKLVSDVLDLCPYDLRTVGTITFDPDGSPVVLDADDYTTEPVSKEYGVWRAIRFRNSFTFSSDFYSSFGYNTVDIEGAWGFASVPPAVSRACVITVQSWLNRDPADWTQIASGEVRGFMPVAEATFSIPLAARRLLDPYRRFTTLY